MKHLYRIAVLLVNLCLLTVFIIGPALYLAASPGYYKTQFEKTGIYATVTPEGEEVRTPIHYIGGKARSVARFTDAQLDAIAGHIIGFLFGDTEDFVIILLFVHSLYCLLYAFRAWLLPNPIALYHL